MNTKELLEEIKVKGLKKCAFDRPKDIEEAFTEPESLGSILLRSGVDFRISYNESGGQPLDNTINWFKIHTEDWVMHFPGSQAYGSDGHYDVSVRHASGEREWIKIYAHTTFYNPRELYGIMNDVGE